MQKQDVIITEPGQGKAISVVGDTYRILISGKETGGTLTAIDMLIPPGGGPGPHAHSGFHETFFVIEGEVVVRAEGKAPNTAKKGSFVEIPTGGVIHNFKNESDAVAHMIMYASPAGIEDFFEEVGKPVTWGEFLPPPELNAEKANELKEIAEKHGQVVYPPDYFDK